MFHQYVNEIAVNCISIVRDETKSVNRKMDALDWYARNVEFVSNKILANFLTCCHEIYETQESKFSKNTFFLLEHKSPVVKSLRKLIVETQDKCANEGIRAQLPLYLQLLEVALLSQHNIKKAVNLELHKVLVNILLNSEFEEESKIHSQMCIGKMLVYTDSNIIVDMIGTPYFAH